MKIGFFDSGLGGQVVMQDFKREFPDMEMLLEMDRANCPYGGRERDEIRELTATGVEKLFARGADVVIIACNTASVNALRWMQQERFVGKHILGVTVPGAEAVVEGGYKKIGVLATEATVRTRMYKERVHILDDSVIVEEVGAPGLVPLIEQGITDGEAIDALLREYLAKFSPDIEALVLGCTHYPLIRERIERVWGELQIPNSKYVNNTEKNIQTLNPKIQTPNSQSGTLTIIDPGKEASRKFRNWMKRQAN